jgi:hypothetical protein
VPALIDQHDGPGWMACLYPPVVDTVAPAELAGAGSMSVTTKFGGSSPPNASIRFR